MSNEARRTLVVSHDFLTDWRDSMYRFAQSDPDNRTLRTVVNTIDDVIRHGTVVPLDHLTVVELATPVRETPWQRREREQFYSEADSADAAAFQPSGGAA